MRCPRPGCPQVALSATDSGDRSSHLSERSGSDRCVGISAITVIAECDSINFYRGGKCARAERRSSRRGEEKRV